MPVRLSVQGGHGVYTVPGSNDTSPGNHSLTITISGKNVLVHRTFISTGGRNAGHLITTSLNAHLDGGTISGTGLESQGGRTCTLALGR